MKKPHAIGQAIFLLRESRGYTMRQLSDTSGVSMGNLSKLESSRDPNPCYNTLVAVAKGLEMTTAALLRVIGEYENDQ